VFTAGCTFLLIIIGAMVTSKDAGLSVPDWPTSFGRFPVTYRYFEVPLVGGVLYEHGHRMIAQLIGIFTIILAVWTQKVDRRPWMRALGWTALGVVIAQGILGGITVLFYLPPAISTAHATLAQIFFCILVSIALFTNRDWTEGSPEQLPQTTSPRLTTLSVLTVLSVFVQLVLGAAFRHNGLKLIPHIISAGVVTTMILWTTLTALRRYRSVPQLRKAAVLLHSLLWIQLTLGLGAYLTLVVWDKNAPRPLTSMVIVTVAHVAVGALVLATAVVFAIQARRHLAVSSEVPVASTQKAVHA